MLRLHTPEQAAQWLRQRVGAELCTDSRQIGPRDGFIAWPGAARDGRHFVSAALAAGAAACLVEDDGVAAFDWDSDAVATFAGLKAAAGWIAADYYGQPSRNLSVLAVTGTNGKTSTAWWLAQALRRSEGQGGCGLVGTLGVGVPDFGLSADAALASLKPTGLTTPDPVLLQQTLRKFTQRGLSACALEASSIGLVEHRLAGTHIQLAVFTNFTQDHLDYHGSMQAYWQAKQTLFAWPGLQAAVINLGDPKGAELVQQLQGQALDVWTTGLGIPARLSAHDWETTAQGMAFTVREGSSSARVRTPILGLYNVENLLGVMAGLRSLNLSLQDAVALCGQLGPVPGRMQIVADDPLLVVDYAHTPDGLDKALSALQPVARQRGGKLWCVFGCGGDRDPTKRPMMAAVADKLADQLVVTSDNPRTEKPEAIVSQILLGLSHRDGVQVQVDRHQAIEQAVTQADAHDVVLIAGKGHESTQDIGGIRHPFSDSAVALSAWEGRQRHG